MVWWVWSGETIEQDDAGVRVGIVSQSGERKILEAEYAVGCDGSHSTVREQVGIERDHQDFDQLMVLAVIRSRELHEGLKRFPLRSTYRAMDPELKGYWRFFGRIDAEEGFFSFMPVPMDTTRDNYDFHGLMQRAAGFEFACEFDYVGFWDMAVAIAKQYQVGGCLSRAMPRTATRPMEAMGSTMGSMMFPTSNREEFERAWEKGKTDTPARAMTYDPHCEGSSIVFGLRGAPVAHAAPTHSLPGPDITCRRDSCRIDEMYSRRWGANLRYWHLMSETARSQCSSGRLLCSQCR